jgi:hypothetical protein
MLVDNLGILRGDGSNGTITATESGATSLSADATTGKRVIPINKTGRCGIPVAMVYTASNTSGRTWTVTIEACDAANFGNGVVDTVATFPAVTADGSDIMIRRIHTQKKYIRSVITGTGGTGSFNAFIFVTAGAMNT